MAGNTIGIRIQPPKSASPFRDTMKSMNISREVFCENYRRTNEHGLVCASVFHPC
jgi:hypothetical protein